MNSKNLPEAAILIRISFFSLIVMLLFPVLSCNKQEDSNSAKAAELRYGLTTEPVTLDPLSSSNTADGRSILFNVFEGLVKPDSSGALIPAIAASYKIEQNGLCYVFSLKTGILFHNGEALKAGDVVFSLEKAKESGFSGFNQIEKIEISGENEIKITLKEPDPEFLPYLTTAVVPQNNPDREKNPIGTGPFKIESYAPQESLVLLKNENYWQKDLPKLDKVTIVFISSSDALLSGLYGGNIEGATLTGALLSQLNSTGSSQARFDIIPWYSNTVQLLALNNAEKIFEDVRVRQAINYALDLNGIIETAFFGLGEPSGSPLIPGLKNVYNKSLRDPYPQDTAKAKSLLAEAGYPDGFPLEIVVASNYTMHVDTAQVIVSQLAGSGISGTIRLVDWATWLSEIYRGRNYQATIISLDAANVSPRSFLSRYLSGNGGNFINFKNPEYDRVYNAALAESDEEKRISLYMQAQEVISENAASVYIQDILGFWVFTAGRFGGVMNYPLYIIDFSTIYRQ